jgi:GNAT superfamily N-acetyltransferase
MEKLIVIEAYQISVYCMAEVRLIRYEELDELLELYRQLHQDDAPVERDSGLQHAWDEIYNDKGLFYLVLEENGRIVSSCTLATIKNLTRSLRPYGIIENVITHRDHRKRGYGTKVIHKAIDMAKENNCYKVMLMTSATDEATLRFYESAGLESGIKTGFVRYM